jgi:hypothetical protein
MVRRDPLQRQRTGTPDKPEPPSRASERGGLGEVQRTVLQRAFASSSGVPPPEEVVEMPQRSWSPKRERQYEHVKQGLLEQGRDEDKAEEIAARTVNKERARAGESRTASRTSTDDLSSSRRGGLRSHRGSGGRTKAQLYEEARRKNVKGRSSMTKAQLERAVGR